MSANDRPLTRRFFERHSVDVARELIGMTLLVDAIGGTIVETEAYDRLDPASHSYRGPTPRNRAMFGNPGTAYVYRSYGIHWCLNVVCADASAVLIRALAPTHGLATMRQRRAVGTDRLLCAGPGRLTEALAVTIAHDGLPLDAAPFEVLPRATNPVVLAGPRIGLTKAVETPWRFGLAGSRFLSRPFPKP